MFEIDAFFLFADSVVIPGIIISRYALLGGKK